MRKYEFFFKNNVVALLDEVTELYAYNKAVVDSSHSITYSELKNESNRLANAILKLKPGYEETFVVLMPRSVEFVIAILGIWKSKCVYLPVDPDFPNTRIRQMIRDGGASHVIINAKDDLDNELTTLLEEDGISLLELNRTYRYSEVLPVPEIDGNHLSYMIFTSGTTGKPKGAMIEHAGMLNHLYAKIDLLAMNDQSILAQNASQCFDISIWQIFSALLVGGTSVIYENNIVFNVDQFLYKLDDDKVSILELVPSYLKIMVKRLARFGDKRPGFKNLKKVIVNGEVLHPKLCDEWFRLYPDIAIINAYGTTEVSDDVLHHEITKTPEGIKIPIGKPIANIDIYILDESLNKCAIGEEGDLYVSGIGVGRGYLNAEDLTAKSFLPDPFKQEKSMMYRTGDQGRFLTDGSLDFLGRKDKQVKVNGHRIELEEIEFHLLEIPEIDQAVVEAIDFSGSDVLCAYVVLLRSGEITADGIKTTLKSKLPAHMVPPVIRFIDDIPLTENGKIDRRVLAV